MNVRFWSAALAVPLGLAVPGMASAQAMYKCLKGNAVTYSNTPCDQLGLTSAGQVKDRMTTLPMGGPAQAKGAAAPGAKPTGSKPGGPGRENEIDMPKTSTIKPVNPLIEKLAK